MGVCDYGAQKKYELNFEDEDLKCPICEKKYCNIFKIPKNLPCGHTICQDCIGKIKTLSLNYSFLVKCPFDQLEYEFQNFPTSYTILQTIETLRKKEENNVKRGVDCVSSEDRILNSEHSPIKRIDRTRNNNQAVMYFGN
jgi:hypothetical protein